MPPHADLLIDILHYIKSLQKKGVVPRRLTAATTLLSQGQAQQLPGVEINAEDGSWLRVVRQEEVAPPAAEGVLLGWVDNLDDPEVAPTLMDAVVHDPIAAPDEDAAQQADREEALATYIRGPWGQWAQEETARRQTNARYKILFETFKNLKQDNGAEYLEVALGLGIALWKTPDGTEIQYPILIQSCEINMLDGPNPIMEIRPADASTVMSTGAFHDVGVDSVGLLETYKQGLGSALEEVDPFDEATFEHVLRSVAGRLDPSGRYESIGGPDTATEQLVIRGQWTFFLRERPADRILRDLAALEATIENAPDIPGMLQNLVDAGTSENHSGRNIAFRGTEPVRHKSGDGTEEVRDLYFPLPYNDEQVSILQKLEANQGVVVQGPPGTGKSHTIANIICHYLAEGKTILVTSSAAGALAVLRDKIPEGVRNLTASLLSSDTQSVKEFEQSISEIAARISGFDFEASERRIEGIEARINELHGQVNALDDGIEQMARENLVSHTICGQTLSAMAIGKMVYEGQGKHGWLDDSVSDHIPEELAQALTRARIARQSLGDKLIDARADSALPDAEALPSLEQVSQAWAWSVRLGQIKQAWEHEGLPALKAGVDLDAKEQLLRASEEKREQVAGENLRLQQSTPAWDPQKIAGLIASTPPDDHALGRLCSLCRELGKRYRIGRKTDGTVDMSMALLDDGDAHQAISRLKAGKAAFGLLDKFGHQSSKALMAGVRINGAAPVTAEAWGQVLDRIGHLRQARGLRGHWNSMAGLFSLPTLDTKPGEDPTIALSVLKTWGESFLGLVKVHSNLAAQDSETRKSLLGADTISNTQCLLSIDLAREQAKLNEMISPYLEEVALLGEAGRFGRWANQQLSALLDDPSADPSLVVEQLHAELSSLNEAQREQEAVARACQMLRGADAPAWAQRCAKVPAEATGEDAIIPGDWESAWRWKRASMTLDTFGNHKAIRSAFEQRQEATLALGRLYQEMIEERSWMRVAQNSTPQIRQSLQKYLGAVRKIGSGTGVRARRHQAVAREAMKEAYQAIPCWIMPYQRVSESMPAQLGLFDLVVIDEASQSDIQVMPAIMRGKKLLVVGDDKQVSPSAVGKGEEEVGAALKKYLDRLPFKHKMTPDQSIYDLFSEVFAGNDVMLREHFRSVRAIIEFSNREFYGGKIIPLRMPNDDQRMNPPLVDILVHGGVYAGDVNMPEAMAVCQEVVNIINDPGMNEKTIGVVTLTSSEKQAVAIRRLLADMVSPGDYMKHDISVGPPPMFQGKERDIILVSMVWDGRKGTGPSNMAVFEQRFNVALSRARDRMILVRSVPNGQARPGGLLARVMGHFEQPFPDDGEDMDPIGRCETELERDIATFLVDKGYRVKAHVGSRGFKIDLVVEGDLGRRLAIGCDGDHAGQVEQWPTEMSRQRVLERAGWSFWRCFAGHYAVQREALQADLIATLEANEIRAQGSDHKHQWVEHRQVGVPADAQTADAQTADAQTADAQTADEGELADSTQGVDEPPQFGTDPGQWPADRDALMALCDPKSPPEKWVLDALLDRGYRVHPQYKVNGYFIDFLVQDAQGRRLAIEYDGDSKYDDPNYFEHERKRQVYLENVSGIPFWRVFHSDWMKRRSEMIAQMLDALEQAGVQPMDRS